MRTAFALVGLGFFILIIGWYFLARQSPASSGESQAPVTLAGSMSSTTLSLTSSEFEYNDTIPSIYTCDGDQSNPPLTIAGVPAGAQSLALIMFDPDVPAAVKPDRNFDHWVLFNIPATTTKIDTGEHVGTPGNNGSGKAAYTGPCPPPQYEPSEHRYFFKLYALDTQLQLPQGATRAQVETAMTGHILADATLLGRYKKK